MSATSAAGATSATWCTSVRIGTPCFALISARIANPFASPGPRNACPLVRFALSYDALNTSGMFSFFARAASRAARSSAIARLSITHGPAISASGALPPKRTPPAFTAFTGALGNGFFAMPGPQSLASQVST